MFWFKKVDTKCRELQDKWTDEYLFFLHSGKPMRLLYYETISVLKEYNMKRHYSSKHFAQYHLLMGQLKRDNIKKLITDLYK